MTDPEPKAIEIDDLSTEWDAYLNAKKQREGWQKIEEDLKGFILGRLRDNDAQVGKINGKPAVGWRFVSTRRFDAKTFRKENPGLADKYMIDGGRNEFGPITE